MNTCVGGCKRIISNTALLHQLNIGIDVIPVQCKGNRAIITSGHDLEGRLDDICILDRRGRTAAVVDCKHITVVPLTTDLYGDLIVSFGCLISSVALILGSSIYICSITKMHTCMGGCKVVVRNAALLYQLNRGIGVISVQCKGNRTIITSRHDLEGRLNDIYILDSRRRTAAVVDRKHITVVPLTTDLYGDFIISFGCLIESVALILGSGIYICSIVKMNTCVGGCKRIISNTAFLYQLNSGIGVIPVQCKGNNTAVTLRFDLESGLNRKQICGFLCKINTILHFGIVGRKCFVCTCPKHPCATHQIVAGYFAVGKSNTNTIVVNGYTFRKVDCTFINRQRCIVFNS